MQELPGRNNKVLSKHLDRVSNLMPDELTKAFNDEYKLQEGSHKRQYPDYKYKAKRKEKEPHNSPPKKASSPAKPAKKSQLVSYLVLWAQLVCWLVGALGPVNHKELHKGWTLTSLYLQVTHFTSYHTKSQFKTNIF